MHCPMGPFTKTAQMLISVLCLCLKFEGKPSWFFKGLIPKCHIPQLEQQGGLSVLASSGLQREQSESKPSLGKNV